MEYQNENFNGEYDFRSRSHKGWHMNENLHEYSELLYCKEGEGDVLINGATLHLLAGQMVWIPPNYVHGYRFGTDTTVICAVFSNDFIPLFFQSTEGRFFRVSPIDPEELSTVLDIFPQLQRRDRFIISGYLNLLCDKVLRQSDFDNESHTDGVLYQKVISYVQTHYKENITLNQIAKHFGYNEKYLSHALYKLTGIHFRRLLAFYRIRHAKKLLENEPNMTVTVISAESGFGAINTFNRTFKEIVGITPLEHRRRFMK